MIFSNADDYFSMSENARLVSRKYAYPKMIEEIDKIIQ